MVVLFCFALWKENICIATNIRRKWPTQQTLNSVVSFTCMLQFSLSLLSKNWIPFIIELSKFRLTDCWEFISLLQEKIAFAVCTSVYYINTLVLHLN